MNQRIKDKNPSWNSNRQTTMEFKNILCGCLPFPTNRRLKTHDCFSTSHRARIDSRSFYRGFSDTNWNPWIAIAKIHGPIHPPFYWFLRRLLINPFLTPFEQGGRCSLELNPPAPKWIIQPYTPDANATSQMISNLVKYNLSMNDLTMN